MNESAPIESNAGEGASQDGDDAGGESSSGQGSAPDEGPERPRPHASAPSDAGLGVDLTLETEKVDTDTALWLIDIVPRIAAEADVLTGSLSLVVVEDDQMADLHMQFRQEAGTTDVLTFDMRDLPDDAQGDQAGADHVDGEVVICVDEAARQAAERGHEVRLELLLYAIHGLLHLLGYDDHSETEFARMHEREDQLLKAVGLAPVYASGG